MELLLLFAAYLLGSVSTGIVVSRLAGLPDPRTFGSRNMGATNVLRTGRKGAAAFTLGGDLLKGLLPILLARAVGVDDPWVAAVGFAAFVGHLYPVWYRFRGGKGVATSLGVLLGWHWIAGVGVVAVWFVVAAVGRRSSLAALVAALAAPALIWWATCSVPLLCAAVAMTALVWWRHRSNIRNLLAGSEPRIGGG